MYNIGRVVLSLLQMFRTIYSAEKGKKGQIVIARYVWKRERERGRPWRRLRFVTLTFPFAAVASPARPSVRPSARGPHPRAYSFLTSPARFTPPTEPFGQTRTIPPRIRRPGVPDCRYLSSVVLTSRPSTRDDLSGRRLGFLSLSLVLSRLDLSLVTGYDNSLARVRTLLGRLIGSLNYFPELSLGPSKQLFNNVRGRKRTKFVLFRKISGRVVSKPIFPRSLEFSRGTEFFVSRGISTLAPTALLLAPSIEHTYPKGERGRTVCAVIIDKHG